MKVIEVEKAGVTREETLIVIFILILIATWFAIGLIGYQQDLHEAQIQRMERRLTQIERACSREGSCKDDIYFDILPFRKNQEDKGERL